MAKSSSATKKILWWIGGLVIILVILGVVGRVTVMFGGGGSTESVETTEASFRTISRTLEPGDEVKAREEGEQAPPFVAARE